MEVLGQLLIKLQVIRFVQVEAIAKVVTVDSEFINLFPTGFGAMCFLQSFNIA